MMNCLFLLVCYTGIVPLELSVSHKYYLIQPGKTWSDAQAYCQATYTDLAIIRSDDDMVQLQSEAQRQHFSSSAWIGLYNDISSWRWSFGHELLGSVTYWKPGEPNNVGGHEECAVKYQFVWNDATCSSKYPFVCFDDSKSGNDRYVYISHATTWLGAQSYCRQHHTDLASARNTTENSVITGLISDFAWVGLFRDAWKWSDQSNVSNNIWKSGKPDNIQGNENCGYINNNQAADARCSDTMPFFCYSEITKKQIIKVKIQSNQDVTDVAVKSAILEQIKQKLMDHGMAENITVKWREQPNGVVFHKEREGNMIRKPCV